MEKNIGRLFRGEAKVIISKPQLKFELRENKILMHIWNKMVSALLNNGTHAIQKTLFIK